MKTQQTGFGALHLLVVAATIAAVTFVTRPEHQTAAHLEQLEAQKVKVAQALDFAGESKRKIGQSVMVGNPLPRTADEAYAMKPTMAAKPEFVKAVKFQPDYAGETVMIMVYLDDGAVENLLGGEQYIYIAGIKTGEAGLEWQCGARNVDLTLLPEGCRG